MWRESLEMAAARGLTWWREETLDLLALWGKRKVQERLRQSHRNLEIYEEIARGMAARGHRRTALQCRSKAKVLRLAYKRALALNSGPGGAKAACPYYKELHRILKGDASVKPRRLGRRLGLGPLRETVAVKEEEWKVEAVEKEAVWSPSRMSSRSALSPVDGSGRPDCGERNPEDMPPGAIVVDLSPAARLARVRAKKRWVSSLQRICNRMLLQSARQCKAFREAHHRQHEELMECMRAWRKERRESNEVLFDLMRRFVAILSNITKSVLHHEVN